VGIKASRKHRLQSGLVRRKKNAAELGHHADEQIEELLIRRFDRLISVRRFIFLWVLLFFLLFFCAVIQLRGLSAYYQTLKPIPGGFYNEGMVGNFTNSNPIYATGEADVAVSRLIFSGLFKYDDKNNLVGDLAKNWQINTAQTRYLVHLKDNIHWHDGQPFTADDVVFTYQSIQNFEAQSPFYTSWKGITVKKIDAHAVVFELPNSLSAFPYSLTNGILPSHLLKNIPPTQMRSASFNANPIGTGPFKWKFVEVAGNSSTNRQQHITMSAFDKYWSGKPKLDGFSIITFSDNQHLIDAFKKKQLNAISGLESLPNELSKDPNIHTYATPLTGAVMAFFNNTNPILSDAAVRQALVNGVDRKQVVSVTNYPVEPINGPLLNTQLGYDPAIGELPFDAAKANDLLNKAGWVQADGNIRTKDGKPLVVNLTYQDTPEYTQVARFLQSQWQKLGLKVNLLGRSTEDLQTSVIAGHDYDILLYGISLGVDPDVFVYWHSSQSSITSAGHLNLSEYKSRAADQALEGGRTRPDPALRVVKYKAFLETWVQDAPALALYQPNFVYITNGPVYEYERKADNSGADRFYSVNQWMVRQKRQDL
jgi:peptide/nickel transport system substrate-binding protein